MLLLVLQNKLTLSLKEKSLTQSERKNLIELTFVLQLTEILIQFDTELAKSMRNKRNILTKLIFMFKLSHGESIFKLLFREKSSMIFLTIFMKSRRNS